MLCHHFQSVYWMVCFRHLFIGAMLPGGRSTFAKNPARFVQLFSFVCLFSLWGSNTRHNQDLIDDCVTRFHQSMVPSKAKVRVYIIGIKKRNANTHRHRHTQEKGADTQEAHTSCGRWTIHIVPVMTGGSRLVLFPLHLWSLQGLVLISVISTGGFCCHLFMLLFLYPWDDGTCTDQPTEANLFRCAEVKVYYSKS